MNKKSIFFLVIACLTTLLTNTIKFNFKGGTSNTIDIAFFKNKGKFDSFIKMIGGSQNIADEIEKFTKKNSDTFANTVGAVAGTIATATVTTVASAGSFGSLAPVAAASGVIIVPAFQKAAQFGFENYGRIAQATAWLIRKIASEYSNHYFEDMKPMLNNSVCRGFTGKRLIRRKSFPIGKDDLMDPKNPQPFYLVIFNKENVKDENNAVFAKVYDIIYAGEISAQDAAAVFDIKTYTLINYSVDEKGEPIKDAQGNPIILDKSIGAQLTKTSNTGGANCP